MAFFLKAFPESIRLMLNDLGLLALRLGLGGMMAGAHGWSKFSKVVSALGGNEEAKDWVSKFPDPLRIGNALSAFSASAAEFIAAILLMVGLASRLNAAALAFTMFVAGVIVHWPDPFQRKELALVYLVGFVALMLTGPGRLSADHLILKKWGSK